MAEQTRTGPGTPAAAGEDVSPVVVFDMSALRFVFGSSRRHLTVLTAAGENLAVVPARPTEADDVVVFRALTAAVDQTRVLRADAAGQVRGYAVALYNPFTAQVAYTGPEGTATFANPGPCAVPDEGVPGQISGPAGARRLVAGLIDAAEIDPDINTTTRTLAAYQ